MEALGRHLVIGDLNFDAYIVLCSIVLAGVPAVLIGIGVFKVICLLFDFIRDLPGVVREYRERVWSEANDLEDAEGEADLAAWAREMKSYRVRRTIKKLGTKPFANEES